MILALAGALIVPAVPAQVQSGIAAQKAAMEKIRFLAGTWTGEAVVSPGQGNQFTLRQTEEVQYKLDGLLMMIEGTGRDAAGKIAFNAFAVISFDQSTGSYRIRAWNQGNFVETEIKVEGSKFQWGFQRGPLTVIDHMELDEQGRWSEVSEATLADGRKVHSVKMMLSRKPTGPTARP